MVNIDLLVRMRAVAKPRLDVMIDSSGACAARDAFSNSPQ